MTTSDPTSDPGQPPAASPSPEPPGVTGLPFGIEPSQPTTFDLLRYAAVASQDDEIVVDRQEEDLLVVRSTSGKRGALVALANEANQAALKKRISLLLGQWPVAQGDLVVVAPESLGAPLLKSAKPMITQGRVRSWGVDPQGCMWGASDGPMGLLAEELLGGEDAPDWPLMVRRLAAAKSHAAEVARFQQKLKGRTPYATYSLLAAIGLMFGLQALFGCTENVLGLVRMGGTSKALVAQGELWRLLSGAFLHAGVMHLLFNMVVLFVLGQFVERYIGTARFVLLYVASALVGALASVAFSGAAVSVGASGAIWGILAAQGFLAFVPGYLPAALTASARRSAGLNLGINVANSFRPLVDWAAHFGGGLAGVAVLWLLLRGRKQPPARTPQPASRPLRAAAVVSAAILLGAALLGPLRGAPWLLSPESIEYHRVAIDPWPLSLELPASLVPTELDEPGSEVSLRCGDLLSDPAVVEIAVVPIGTISPEAMPAELEALRGEMSETPPDGLEATEDPKQESLSGRSAITARYQTANGFLYDRIIAIHHQHLVRVDVVYWPDFEEYGRQVARRAAGSLELTTAESAVSEARQR